MILCVCPNLAVDGYVWLDHLSKGETNRSKKEAFFPGGKGVHVALALAELGEEVELLSFWAGPTGSWVKEYCEKRGIHCAGPPVSGWNRFCFTFKSEGALDDTELLGAGPSVSAENIRRFEEIFEERLQESDLICMSGSWPQGAPPKAYSRFIQTARQYGAKVFLDCSGDLLDYALKAEPFLIHVNKAEGQAAAGLDSVEQMATELAQSCNIAAVTDGKAGLYLAHKSELYHAHCRANRVYSTVGCGDCLVAGLALAFKNSNDLFGMAQTGVACGAANCLREELGMLYKKDVDRLINKTKVELMT